MADKAPFYLREWRKHRGYTLERLAEMIGTSQGHLSDLEKGKKRYNQDHLEALAIALRCSPADLLMRDPGQPESIQSIWDQVPEAQREQARAVLETFAKKAS